MKGVILVVDDKEINRKMLGSIFEDDFDILEAANGEEAIRTIQHNFEKLDMILLDIIMPFKDGFSVLDYMKRHENCNHIPVVVVTTDDSQETEDRGYYYQVADLIRKPYIPGIIKRRVLNIIEIYRGRRELSGIVKMQVDAVERQCRELEAENRKMRDAAEEIWQRNERMELMLEKVAEMNEGEQTSFEDKMQCLSAAGLWEALASGKYGKKKAAEEIISLLCDGTYGTYKDSVVAAIKRLATQLEG